MKHQYCVSRWIGALSLILIALSSQNSLARAVEGTQVVAMSAQIASFQCVAKVGYSGPGNALSEAGIRINDPSGSLDSSQKALIAGVVEKARRLGADDLIKNIQINVHQNGRKGHGCASYTSSNASIELTNNCGAVTGEKTVAHMTHELGHIIGLKNNNYARYNAQVKQQCRVTTYAGHREKGWVRGEELPEVIATYLLAPETLKNTRGCSEAYNFVAEIFNRGTVAGDCSKQTEAPVQVASIGNRSSVAGSNLGLSNQVSPFLKLASFMVTDVHEHSAVIASPTGSPAIYNFDNYDHDAEAVRESSEESPRGI